MLIEVGAKRWRPRHRVWLLALLLAFASNLHFGQAGPSPLLTNFRHFPRYIPPPVLKNQFYSLSTTFSSVCSSFSQIEEYLRQIAEDHGNLVTLSTEGHTYEGRPIYLVRIGPRRETPDRRYIFIDAGELWGLLRAHILTLVHEYVDKMVR